MIGCILESKTPALVAAAFAGFPKNKRNLVYKNKLDTIERYQLYIMLGD